jgi:hypothetical protein
MPVNAETADAGRPALDWRRVVTGTGPGGASRVTASGAAPVITLDGYPGVEIARLWSTDSGAAPGPDGTGRDQSGDAFYPPAGGARFLRISYPPGFGTSDPDAAASQLARLLMHRTDTIDYGAVLAGELTLVLEDGSETILRPGDVIVQNGVVHGWRNAGPVTAVALFVLVGYQS